MIAFNEEPPVDENEDFELVELVENIFKDGGYLKQHLGLEYRPQQSRLAKQIANSMNQDTPLLCEAGTGVGKSLAYLIPGIIHAVGNNRKMIVSAHTIALQEQIKGKDLNICKKLFRKIPELHPFAEFKYSLLIGRGNYLCNYRLARAIEAQRDMFNEEEFSELMRIHEWAKESPNGIRQELSPPPKAEVWEWVTADSTSCNNKNCDSKTCYYRRARNQVNNSAVIILNHSLLFSFLNAGMSPKDDTPGILFPKDFIVLDEAHTIPSIATKHFGMAISSYAIDFNLKTLYNPKSSRGFLKRVGLLSDTQMVEDAMQQSKEFFDYIGNTYLGVRNIYRVRESNFLAAPFLKTMLKLCNRLKDLEQTTSNEEDQKEIKEKAERILNHINAIKSFIELSEEGHVYWMERTGKRGSIVTLQSAPLDIAHELRSRLFTRNTSACLTSATLSIQGNMRNFQVKTGSLAVETFIENSPFNYDKSMRVYIADDAPNLTQKDKNLDIEYLVDNIDFCVQQRPGGTLVLFTSYSDLYNVANALEEKLHQTGRRLLVQGRDYSGSEMIDVFKREGNAVLMGTETYWTGIDVPGLALSQVIICRLPFENPTHPIMEAKCEYIKEQGKMPFNELTLPEALIKFKQGIGRLIRSHKDRGFITVLDSRILHKSYGKLFLECFPHKRFKIFSLQTRDEVFSRP
jgi:ATP-dependent DNA helicase DinG